MYNREEDNKYKECKVKKKTKTRCSPFSILGYQQILLNKVGQMGTRKQESNTSNMQSKIQHAFYPMELRGFVSLIEIIIFSTKLAVCTDKSVKR